MTDHELLKMAAKAAGIADGDVFYDMDNDKEWNPLTDDGDALRLAVKLYIGVRPHGPDHWQQPNVAVALWDFGDKSGRVTVEHGDDPQRATRRAINRAALDAFVQGGMTEECAKLAVTLIAKKAIPAVSITY